MASGNLTLPSDTARPSFAEPIISFPLHGTWLVVNPPGHPAHAYDISAIDASGRLFSASALRMLVGLGHAKHVVGWGRSVYAPVGARSSRRSMVCPIANGSFRSSTSRHRSWPGRSARRGISLPLRGTTS